MEALANSSEQLSKNLIKVIDGVGTKLRGDEAGLAQFAEQLRQTRFVLDEQCREIDRILERIGFGDTDPTADTETDSN